jgi:hypothetical protein
MRSNKLTDLVVLTLEYKDLQNNTTEIDWLKELNDIADITTTIIDVLSTGTFDAKRSILTKLGSRLTWDDEKLLIDSKKSINTFINGVKTVKPILSKFGNQKALVKQELNDNSSELCTALRRLWDEVGRKIMEGVFV